MGDNNEDAGRKRQDLPKNEELTPEATPETLFEGALRFQTQAEREAYLDRVCAVRPELRKHLEQLLEAHDCSGDFLHEPAGTNHPTMRLDHPLEEGPGTMIGRYKLLQKIGEGGMGIVYMAEQREPVLRRVAFKIIKLGMDTRQVVARFEAERQALALMDHPNIAKVLDGGATDTGRPYFVMELVQGVPITEYCDKNRLSTKARLELFIPVCQAIQHAHQKGIIHRDIKPSNVMVTLHDGQPVPRVIDFGIAKATNQRLTEKTLFTNFATIIGTPAYMSPEQAEMSGLDIDSRTDVYSLGVVLYELLAGTTPFDVKELLSRGYGGMQRIIAEQEPLKPSTRMGTMRDEERTAVARNRSMDVSVLGRSLKGDLDCIVMKCLEKDRSRRYETANGLAMDIFRYLSDEPLAARPSSAVYRVRKLIRRHRLAAASTAVVTAAFCLTLAVLIVTTVRVTKERNQKNEALLKMQAAVETARQREGEAAAQLARSLASEGRAHRYSRRVGQRVNSLADLAASARIEPREDGLRDDAIAALALPDIRTGLSWKVYFPGYQRLVFDDQYRRYARTDESGTTIVSTVPDNREIQRIASNPSKTVSEMLLSPDGKFVARLEGHGLLRVWRVADGVPVLSETPTNCSGWAFSQDSRQLAFGRGAWIHLVDLASGQEQNRWEIESAASTLAFSPDHQRVAVGYLDAAVCSVYDAIEGKRVATLPVGPIRRQIVAWHPDGIHLAVAGSDPRIQIWNLEVVRQIARMEGHVQEITALTFHPAGGLLASASWDGILRLWDPWTGREWLHAPMEAQVRFSRDGTRLGVSRSSGGQCQLWEVAANPHYRTLSAALGVDRHGYYEGDISPDGGSLALGMQDGVRIWDLASGRETALLEGASRCARFREDGLDLMVCSPLTGLRHWSFAQNQHGRLQPVPLGPLPASLVSPSRFCLAEGGRKLAVASEEANEAVILNLANASHQPIRVPHRKCTFVALSPDGLWLATSGWHATSVRLWEAATGKLVHTWSDSRQSRVFFTPDGRELLICRGDEFAFWDVTTRRLTRSLRREVPIFPGYVAFSTDGGLMALEMTPGIVDLKEVTTARTIARLEDPFGDQSSWMAFTPSGSELVTVAGYSRAIHIWNLHGIREELKTLGLDGNWTGLRE